MVRSLFVASRVAFAGIILAVLGLCWTPLDSNIRVGSENRIIVTDGEKAAEDSNIRVGSEKRIIVMDGQNAAEDRITTGTVDVASQRPSTGKNVQAPGVAPQDAQEYYYSDNGAEISLVELKSVDPASNATVLPSSRVHRVAWNPIRQSSEAVGLYNVYNRTLAVAGLVGLVLVAVAAVPCLSSRQRPADTRDAERDVSPRNPEKMLAEVYAKALVPQECQPLFDALALQER